MSFYSARYPIPKERGAHGDVAVLLSGGLDSMTLAYMALSQNRLGAAIGFDYGQPAAPIENWIINKFISERYIMGRVIKQPMDWEPQILGFTGEVGPMVIPGRNLLMLTVAAQWLRVHVPEIKELWYGATLDDEQEYADCRWTFVYELNQLMKLIEIPIEIKVPFVESGMDKRSVVRHARSLEVPINETFSCYTPKEIKMGPPVRATACRTCNACVQRSEALCQSES